MDGLSIWSEYPLRFRSPILRKTASPYDREFGAQNEYSDFHKTLIISTGFGETSY